MKKFNPITRKYQEVRLANGYYTNDAGDKLFRIETKGRTGRTQYRNEFYLHADGKESSVYGAGGATGHGWGGQIIGYATEQDMINSSIR